MVSLSAGFVEEIFFRGFLQPRVGIALSTAFFVLAHVSYGQPLMLVGIALLSLIFGFLVRWRQTDLAGDRGARPVRRRAAAGLRAAGRAAWWAPAK
jgi:hypothetical protein